MRNPLQRGFLITTALVGLLFLGPCRLLADLYELLPIPNSLGELSLPKVSANEIIEKIDPKDNSLVTISIGSDAGLAKDQTLDVYRLKPEPRYLGMIRIIKVTPQKAVGRLVHPSTRFSLSVRDKATSKLSEQK